MITEKDNVFYCDCGFSFQRGRSGAHDCADGLRNKLVESESRCAALAAENAGLKAALRPSDIPSEWTDAFGDTAVIEHDSTGDNQWHSVSWSWVGNQEEVIKSVLLAVDKGIETPATDAFLAEVRAQGKIEGAESALQIVFAGGSVQACREYISQLRKGVQS
ncbi:hypothetical protein LN389_13555 [Enterobacter hormaechei subsp. steigerwaltii]|uniref:hypothetical protein n=1 Tax=Enterobacter hormaechei TaxID=158836 RepID=UPI001E2F216A|nr:hypothetical protein [Enterobacter hormaechei]MCC9378918.1 hypothetical protein [Enterobacter hormaechei subsp. steigerwaltii]MCC9392855.1 hypothetical protein [Enterobacter hormaechei subsp. steigerwaltii]MCC9419328.1 hypothetical protein [Enterobacter hormaechei subsp. steigerwaltii]MCD0214445.1 hypothetical protein [Enterobacter hormaechei subsp. steigerwaltii]